MVEVKKGEYLLYERIVRLAVMLFPDRNIGQIEKEILGRPFREIRKMSEKELRQVLQHLESLA